MDQATHAGECTPPSELLSPGAHAVQGFPGGVVVKNLPANAGDVS